jgi:hypothetical protein
MKNVDYTLLCQIERVRYQFDYSSAHWLHQVISMYERGIVNKLRLEAFEKVLRTAINCGVKKAVELSLTYPSIAGFPQYLKLKNYEEWKNTQDWVKNNLEFHLKNRFGYLRQGD